MQLHIPFGSRDPIQWPRRTAPQTPLWLVSAWAVDRTMTLGPLATDEKSNEITANPQLLDNSEIKGAVVTIDAAGCQREIAKKIIDGGAIMLFHLRGIRAHCIMRSGTTSSSTWKTTSRISLPGPVSKRSKGMAELMK